MNTHKNILYFSNVMKKCLLNRMYSEDVFDLLRFWLDYRNWKKCVFVSQPIVKEKIESKNITEQKIKYTKHEPRIEGNETKDENMMELKNNKYKIQIFCVLWKAIQRLKIELVQQDSNAAKKNVLVPFASPYKPLFNFADMDILLLAFYSNIKIAKITLLKSFSNQYSVHCLCNNTTLGSQEGQFVIVGTGNYLVHNGLNFVYDALSTIAGAPALGINPRSRYEVYGYKNLLLYSCILGNFNYVESFLLTMGNLKSSEVGIITTDVTNLTHFALFLYKKLNVLNGCSHCWHANDTSNIYEISDRLNQKFGINIVNDNNGDNNRVSLVSFLLQIGLSTRVIEAIHAQRHKRNTDYIKKQKILYKIVKKYLLNKKNNDSKNTDAIKTAIFVLTEILPYLYNEDGSASQLLCQSLVKNNKFMNLNEKS